jgi:hypothetical protein
MSNDSMQTKNMVVSTPTEEEKLYSVLTNITFGIVGILILLRLIESVKESEFAYRNSIISLINGLITALLIGLWQGIFIAMATIMGPQTVYDAYLIVMMVILIGSFGICLYGSIYASKGKLPRYPWISPITQRFFKW